MPFPQLPPSSQAPNGGLSFGHFFLAGPTGPLYQGKHVLHLQKRPLAMLWHLACHSGQVVSKTALMQAVWSGRLVTESAIGVCLLTIRKTLGDEVKSPKLIATEHGEGYRFLPPTVTGIPAWLREEFTALAQAVSAPSSAPRQRAMPANGPFQPVKHRLAGRDAALNALALAQNPPHPHRRTQVVLVSGETGIGKSTLLSSFAEHLQTSSATPTWIARGQCPSEHSQNEPFVPLFQALAHLAQGPDRDTVLPLIQQHAPAWWQEMPALHADAAPCAMPTLFSISQEHLLREFSSLLEHLSLQRPVVLMLEDIHWSDSASLEWLSLYTAQPQASGRVLVVLSVRPSLRGLVLSRLQATLQAQGKAQTLHLPVLSAQAVTEHVATHAPSPLRKAAAKLGPALHAHTLGHPLFLAHLLAEFETTSAAEAMKQLSSTPLPAHLPCQASALIAQQLQRLPASDLELLEAASLAQRTFTAATLAALLDRPLPAVAETLTRLSQDTLFLQPHTPVKLTSSSPEAIPNGPPPPQAPRQHYTLRHALHRSILQKRLTAKTQLQLRWHACMAAQLQPSRGQGEASASELALHQEAAQQWLPAAQQRQRASRRALRLQAPREAYQHAQMGLQLLARSTSEDPVLRLNLLLSQGSATLALHGYGAVEGTRLHETALQLSLQQDGHPKLGRILMVLCYLHLIQAELSALPRLSTLLDQAAQQKSDPTLTLISHTAKGFQHVFNGQPQQAMQEAEAALQLQTLEPNTGQLLEHFGQDPVLMNLHSCAHAAWLLHQPERLQQCIQRSKTRAQSIGDDFGLAQTLWVQALHEVSASDLHAGERTAFALLNLADRHGFPLWHAGAEVLYASARALQGRGTTQNIENGIRNWRSAGVLLAVPVYQSLLAKALLQEGEAEQALDVLQQATDQAQRTGEFWFKPELLRLQAKGLMTRSHPMAKQQALQHLAQAQALAMQQGALRWLPLIKADHRQISQRLSNVIPLLGNFSV